MRNHNDAFKNKKIIFSSLYFTQISKIIKSINFYEISIVKSYKSALEIY